MNDLHPVEDYFAGVLDQRQRDQFERHLAACVRCRKELAELEALHTLLSNELPKTLPSRQPRPEWVKQVKAQFHPARRPMRWLALGAVPVLVAAVALALLLILRQTADPLTAQEHLKRAYAATMLESFQGRFTVLDGQSLALTGTFAYAPDGRWAVTKENSAGQRIEETRVQGENWRRADGDWASVGRAPLYVRTDNPVIVSDLPDLFGTVPSLREVQRPSRDTYVGVASAYEGRPGDDRGGANLNMLFMLKGFPQVEAQLADGRIKRIHVTVLPAHGEPMLAKIVIESYGIPVHIEAPSE
ncbi:MAG: zf-HC2 domain-containing protein [Chloroflexi bacterium]|nr:zf-HC2 domain-containing protein [Chloroflexota bacterium]